MTAVSSRRRPRSKQAKSASDLFRLASDAWDAGEERRAFRLFLAAAKAGDLGALLNLGFFYDEGIGVRQNHEKALALYRRAYRRGDGSAANNIAIMMRNRGQLTRAAAWFERAIRLGNDDSNLQLAEIFEARGDVRRAILHLQRIRRSRMVTEMTREAALERLKTLEGRRATRRARS